MARYPIQFGKYLLLERVNVGGMAEVFKCKTFGVAGFEKLVALKRILPTMVEDEEFVRMFIDEARISVQLNHANIIQIYELGRHGDHYYIAMEYVPSRDLRAILDKLRASGSLMPIPQAAFLASKVCEGLDYAHRKRDPSGSPMNIIHRDVSPQNVLVGFEGEVKVIDFGIAKAANRASKTQAGVLKGKFGYMSPEQVRGLPIDRRSDVFAVGVLLYEMLTGERLFVGESDFSTLEKVRNAEVVPPTVYNKKITRELEGIVMKALAREVEDRYQWSSDLVEDLQPFLIEERSIFSTKRLANYMREAYVAEIAMEQAKMEEYLKITAPAEAPVEQAGPERTFVFEAGALAAQVEAQQAARKAPLQSGRAARLTGSAEAKPLEEEEPDTDPSLAQAGELDVEEDPDFVDHGASEDLDAKTIATEFMPPVPRKPAASAPAAAAAPEAAPAPSFGRIRSQPNQAPVPTVSGASARLGAGGASSTRSSTASASSSRGALESASSSRGSVDSASSSRGNAATFGRPSNGRSSKEVAPNTSGMRMSIESSSSNQLLVPDPNAPDPNARANTGLKQALEDEASTGELLVDPSAATQAVSLADIAAGRTGFLSAQAAPVPSATSPISIDMNDGDEGDQDPDANGAGTPVSGGNGKVLAEESTERRGSKTSQQTTKPQKSKTDADTQAKAGGGLSKKHLAIMGGGLLGLLFLAVVVVVAMPRGKSGGTIHVALEEGIKLPDTEITIALDGDEKGTAFPLDISDVPPGQHKVVIKGKGLLTVADTVVVNAGHTSNINVHLELLSPAGEEPAQAPPPDAEEVKPCKKGDKKCEAERKKKLAEQKRADAKDEQPESGGGKGGAKDAKPAGGDDTKAAGDDGPGKDNAKKGNKKSDGKRQAAAKKDDDKKAAAAKNDDDKKDDDKKAAAAKKDDDDDDDKKGGRKSRKDRKKADRKERAAAAAPSKKGGAADATLAIGTPTASVFVDGKNTKLVTPIPLTKNFKLSSGKHVLMFVTKDGTKYKYSVTVAPGEGRLIIPKLGGPPREGTASLIGKPGK